MDNGTFTINGELTLDSVIGEVTLSPGNGYDSPPEVEPYTLGDMLLDRMVEKLIADLRGKEGGRFDKVAKKVEKEIERQVNEKVTEWVAVAIDQPLQKTDEWGAPTGKPMTLVELVRNQVGNHLRSDQRGTYGRDSVVGKAINETTQNVLAKDLKDEIDSVKADLRGRVHASASQVLADSITKALGA
jgi:hypothetical protein